MVGSACSGGGTRSPVTWEICRADVFRYENGSDPVFREISNVYTAWALNHEPIRRSRVISRPRA